MSRHFFWQPLLWGGPHGALLCPAAMGWLLVCPLSMVSNGICGVGRPYLMPPTLCTKPASACVIPSSSDDSHAPRNPRTRPCTPRPYTGPAWGERQHWPSTSSTLGPRALSCQPMESSGGENSAIYSCWREETSSPVA